MQIDYTTPGSFARWPYTVRAKRYGPLCKMSGKRDAYEKWYVPAFRTRKRFSARRRTCDFSLFFQKKKKIKKNTRQPFLFFFFLNLNFNNLI